MPPSAPHRPSFRVLSTHSSVEDATLAVHSLDSSLYTLAYNYGSFGNGKVYRCVSHENCPRRVRISRANTEDEESDSDTVTYNLEIAEDHGTERTNKKRMGIDPIVKVEVDALLVEGSSIKKCRTTLEQKYARQPELLAKIPNVGQLKNRRTTLRKQGELLVSSSKGPRRSKRERKPVETVQVDDQNSSNDDDQTTTTQQEDAKGREDREEHEVPTWERDPVETVQVDEQNCSTVDDQTTTNHQEDAELEEESGVGDDFEKTKLMKQFAELPGRPVFWNILKKSMSIDAKTQTITTQWINGQVIGWTTSNSTTKWIVQFSDGDKRPFELEELVDEIRAAVELGLNVSGRTIRF